MNAQHQSVKLISPKGRICLLKLAATCALSINGISAPPKPTSTTVVRDAKQAHIDRATMALFNALSSPDQESDVSNAIRNGANVTFVNGSGWSTLHVATICDSVEYVRILLKAGAKLDARDKEGATALFYARSAEMAATLIGSGINVNAADNEGRTALHRHVFPLYSEVAKGIGEVLISRKANVNAQDHDGNTPLHLTDDPVYASLLLQHKANVEIKNKMAQTPLERVMERLAQNTIELASPPNESGYTSTLSDIEQRQNTLMLIYVLLDAGANPNVQFGSPSFKGIGTPLHFATLNHWTELAEFLLNKKADVNALDKSASTPLHDASSQGYVDLARLFIEKGADVNARSKDNWTPLLLAVGNSENTLDLFCLLMQHGADPNIRNSDGDSPFLIAIGPLSDRRRFILNTLLEKGADINAQELVQGSTALHRAAMSGYLDTVHFLISKGAKVNIKSPGGIAPLDFAASEEIKQVLRAAGALPGDVK